MDNLPLRNVYLFSHLDEEGLAEIREALTARELAAGEVLFHMGDPGSELFIVSRGEIAIFAPDEEQSGTEKPIRIFRRGEAFGEMALIDRKPRSLSARAAREAQVLVLQEQDFRRFMRQNSDLAFDVMVGLSDRIRYTTQFLNEVREWVERMTHADHTDDVFIDEVRHWVEQVADGEFPEIGSGRYQDETMAELAAEFARMATRVKQREEALRQEIRELRIEIDEAKRQDEVQSIVETDYFQSLKAQVNNMRQKQEEDE